ncbi:MAG: T9SS type A sorting domain-containing protein [Bacteroidales bacterium]|nr:T9SS type A sorting domain-containing protein [Bacteroidales bacterium]
MLQKIFRAVLIVFFAIPVTAQTTWQSELVKVDENGVITYYKDADGFVIPDFSHAGYKGGEAIPDYRPESSRIVTVTPIANADNTASIQQAINKIAALIPDSEGFRGVVQLAAGRYYVDGTINLNASGVVLRGAGRGPDVTTDKLTAADLQTMTLIYRRGTSGGLATNVVVMGATSAGSATWGSNTSNETGKVNITTAAVLPGDFSFDVQSAAGYSVGDAVCIKYPSTEAFLAAIWYGGNSNWVNNGDAGSKWTTGNLNICYHRYITKIEGNKVTVDAPVFYCLDRQYSQAYMHRITTGSVNTNTGIENLRISMDRTPASITTTPDQNCIKMNALENCWAKGLHLSDFIHAGIKTEAVTRSTIEDCRSVDCSGYYTGANQYNFENYNRSQLILFRDCLSRNGRHHWLSNGGSTVSGIVVLNHSSTYASAASEGHRLFSQGILIDGWKETGWTFNNNANRLGFFLRDNMGTNHGWGAIFSVFWNCDIQNGALYLDKVPTGQNYSIGSIANTVRKYRNSDAKYTTGYNEGQNKPGLFPKSLYEAQLDARRVDIPFAITEHPKEVQTCVNTTVSLSVKAIAPDRDGITYRWKKDGTVITGAVQNVLSYNRVSLANAGVYTVEVSYQGTTLESEPAVVTVMGLLPDPQFSVFPESIHAGGSYQITVADPVNGPYPYVTGYEWEYTGTGITFGQPADHSTEISVANNATKGFLRIRVTHPCGIKVLEKSISIENVTGYAGMDADHIKIFPNPVSDEVHIQNISSVKHIEIVNSLGQKLFSRSLAKDLGELIIRVADYPPGIYFVRLKTDRDTEKTFKLVKNAVQ